MLLLDGGSNHFYMLQIAGYSTVGGKLEIAYCSLHVAGCRLQALHHEYTDEGGVVVVVMVVMWLLVVMVLMVVAVTFTCCRLQVEVL